MIPKIIHHVWPGSDPFKEKFYDFRISWMKNHPDWNFCFWRLDNLPKNIDPRVKEIVLNNEYAITPKSDILRFEIIRLFGGIYSDTDMECLKAFDKFRNFSLFAGYEDDNGNICPSLFGAVPNHRIINDILNLSIENTKKFGVKESNKNPHKITGVKPFTDILTSHTENIDVKLFPKEYFYYINYKNKDRIKETHQDSYAKHYWSGKDDDGWTNVIKF